MKLNREEIEKLIAQNQQENFIEVHKEDCITYDPLLISNPENFLPLMNVDSSGVLTSGTVTVLTQHPTVYGKTLGLCLGKVFWDDGNDELTWKSDDGEEVVGWMPLPSVEHLKLWTEFKEM